MRDSSVGYSRQECNVIRFHAVRPRDLLTDELRLAIRENKRELLAKLPRYRWLILRAGIRGYSDIRSERKFCCLPLRQHSLEYLGVVTRSGSRRRNLQKASRCTSTGQTSKS